MTAQVYHLPPSNRFNDPEPLIPAGRYHLQMDAWETRLMFGKARKLIIWFWVADGEYAGVRLPAYYNVKQFKGAARKKGGFVVGKKSAFARDFFTVLDQCDELGTNYRLDRLPISELKHITILGIVRTVKQANNKQIPKPLQYSVVDELVGV